MQKCN